MRKVLEVIIGGAALSTAMSASALAQSTSIGTATGSVVIVQPINISNTHALVFGRIAPPTAAGTVIVTTAGVQTVSAGSHAVGAQSAAAAAFTVSGDGGASFSVTPNTAFNMTSGTNTIAVALTTSITGGSLGGTPGSTGTLPFNMGGTMSFASAQASGTYSGTFNVTVAYN